MNLGVKITAIIILLLLSANVNAQTNDRLTYNLTVVKKSKFKNSFRDIKTGRKFIIYKAELTNTDTVSHRIDYASFVLTDSNNNSYPAHQYASIIKQTEFQDLTPRMDVDSYGFNNKVIHAKFSISGWLVFEVPSAQEYTLEFKGYID